MAQPRRKYVIAVGYKFTLPVEEIVKKIQEKMPDFDPEVYNIQSEILSGVKYSKTCRGGMTDAMASDEEMRAWYKKKLRHGTVKIPMKDFYVTTGKKANLVIARTTIPPDNLYVFIANPNGISTTQHKKHVVNGRYGDPLDISVTVEAEPYLYEK